MGVVCGPMATGTWRRLSAVVGLTALFVGAILLPSGGAQGAGLVKGSSVLRLRSTPQFLDSAFAVLPGSLVSLRWSWPPGVRTPRGVHYLVTSTVPQFSSASVVRWPARVTPPPRWHTTGWETTASVVTIAIPANAASGEHYVVHLVACESSRCEASGATAVLTIPASTVHWDSKSFRSDFPTVSVSRAPGSPFAATFSNSAIWVASEFSDNITEIPSSGSGPRTWQVTSPHGAPSQFKTPFALCLFGSCRQSAISALSESITAANGWIWLTFGGERSLPSVPAFWTQPNRSEVVGFDPATDKFCTYLVPGNNNQVAGIISSGVPPDSHIWFVESRGPAGRGSLDEFNPATVGRGCQGTSNQTYGLPASVRVLTWPASAEPWPVQIAADPSSTRLWITDFNDRTAHDRPYSEIDEVDVADPHHPTIARRYRYASTNPSAYFGARPWDVLAPSGSNYVYAIDNGDAEIVRIDKLTGQMDEVAIPLTADVEDGFGLAISSGRLYFTLANDNGQTFGAASTFGYIDLSSWADDRGPIDGVIYTALSDAADPRTTADFRGIAVGPSGQIALTDRGGIVDLTP
jgi:hypothetical protein